MSMAGFVEWFAVIMMLAMGAIIGVPIGYFLNGI